MMCQSGLWIQDNNYFFHQQGKMIASQHKLFTEVGHGIAVFMAGSRISACQWAGQSNTNSLQNQRQVPADGRNTVQDLATGVRAWRFPAIGIVTKLLLVDARLAGKRLAGDIGISIAQLGPG